MPFLLCQSQIRQRLILLRFPWICFCAEIPLRETPAFSLMALPSPRQSFASNGVRWRPSSYGDGSWTAQYNANAAIHRNALPETVCLQSRNATRTLSGNLRFSAAPERIATPPTGLWDECSTRVVPIATWYTVLVQGNRHNLREQSEQRSSDCHPHHCRLATSHSACHEDMSRCAVPN